MERYRTTDANDDPPANVGDNSFLGVDEYSSPENIKPGNVQQAVNHDFSSQDAQTRGGFVCLPELGKIPFGQTWTLRDAAAANTWRSVAYGGNQFAAVSSSGTGNRVMTSPDGITWTSQVSAADNAWTSICYGNNRFVAVATAGDYAMTSTDGVTWTLSSLMPSGTYRGVCYGGGLFVAVGDTGLIAYSSDGSTWTAATSSSPTSSMGAVTYGEGIFVAVCTNSGLSGKIAITSPDGINWTTRTTKMGGQITITYGNGMFVSAGFGSPIYTGSIQYSPDGITWTLATLPSSEIWASAAFGSGQFVVVALSSSGLAIITSNDGINWKLTSTIFSRSWNGVTYGDNKFVAVSANGGIDRVATAPTEWVYASNLYSDPDSVGTSFIMLLGADKVGFYAQGQASRTVSLGSYSVGEQSTIVQANNYVYIFRGDNAKPLYWNGDWSTSFTVVPDTTLPATYNSIPNSNQATYYQNRLWVRDGKDSVAASDVLSFTDYDPLANEFNLNTGNSDYVVATFPFGQNSLICFKNKSIELMQNVEGALTDVTVTEVTRQVGLVGINAVTSVGPDLAYVSYGNVNLLTLTATNNSLQHKTLPLSIKVRQIMNRVNWQVGYKISLGYWNNKLYVALPLDNSQFCNSVIVYNFINENWYGEWNFSSDINMCVQGWQVNDYLGLQRMHAITEDGRIFITDEGQNDISGTTVSEISTTLVTRAYDTGNFNHFQRRLYLDMGTCRPSFSCYSYTEGVSEESTLISNQTFSRSQSWQFNSGTYNLTNSGNNYNQAYRKDYSTGPDSVQCGTGFLPEAIQEFRMPLVTRRQGRLSWLKVTNTQGFVSVMSVGFELRAGQRSNLIQV